MSALALYREALLMAAEQGQPDIQKAARRAYNLALLRLSRVRVTVDPEYNVADLRILVDGTEATASDTPRLMQPGRHTVSASAPGRTPFHQEIHTSKGELQIVNVRETRLARVRIRITPLSTEANVTLDGRVLSMVDLEGEIWLEPGNHMLIAHAPGYVQATRAFEVRQLSRRDIVLQLNPRSFHGTLGIGIVAPFILNYGTPRPSFVHTVDLTTGWAMYSLPYFEGGFQVRVGASKLSLTGFLGSTWASVLYSVFAVSFGGDMSYTHTLSSACQTRCLSLGPFVRYMSVGLFPTSDGVQPPIGLVQFVGGGIELRVSDGHVKEDVFRLGYVHSLGQTASWFNMPPGAGVIGFTYSHEWFL